jgi:hypothetical protein
VIRVDDPFGVRTAGDLTVTCQIIHLGQRAGATLIDLVTLEPCDRGDEQIPAGTPLTVGFETNGAGRDCAALERVVRDWQASDAVLVLEVLGVTSGICYVFTDGIELLRLVLDELPPGWERL